MLSLSRHDPRKIINAIVLYVGIFKVSNKHLRFPSDAFHTSMPSLKQSETNFYMGGRFVWNPRGNCVVSIANNRDSSNLLR